MKQIDLLQLFAIDPYSRLCAIEAISPVRSGTSRG